MAENAETEARIQQLTAQCERAEERARTSEKRRWDFIDGLGPTIFAALLTIDGVLIEASATALAAGGRKLEDVIGKPFDEFDSWAYSPEVRQQLREAIRRAASGEPSRYDVTLPMRPGRFMTFDFSLQPLRDEAGKVTFLLASASDVTERTRVEEELRETRDRLQEAVRAGKVGIWFRDLRTNEVYYSPEWKRHIGYNDEEILNDFNEFVSRVHPADLPRVIENGEAYIRDDVPLYESEFRLRHKDGSYRHILARGSKVLDSDGTPIRLFGSHVDITERMELQAQLLQAQKMESIGLLAGGVAHDFNNVLTIINGTAVLAMETLREEGPVRADFRRILQAGERAANLTRQLLAFSRRQIMKPDILDVNVVVGGMENIVRRLIGENIDFKFTPAKNPCPVKADRGQLEQVILNLAVNARDAMGDGGSLTIQTENLEFDAACPGPCVMLSISDTGTGMDEATRARIFEPFFTTKEIGRGTGLGLSTVYGIIKQSGGSILVHSKLGSGTTFKIVLPGVSGKASTDRPEPQAGTFVPGTETILVVEDEAAVRRVAERILQTAGYTVLTAGNGEEALRLLERHDGPVHLVLTDMVMPGISGRELARRIFHVRPTKFLYTSGYTDDAILREGILDKAAAFIGKPYGPQELTRKVRETLDSK